jgi:hypothetical protein
VTTMTIRFISRVAGLTTIMMMAVAWGREARADGFFFDFESFPPGINQQVANRVVLNAQYASQNLMFPTLPGVNTDQAMLEAASAAATPHSGEFAVAGPNSFHEFDDTPFDLEFVAGQYYVQFWGGSDCADPGQYGQVTGYDQLGNIVAVADAVPIAGRSASTPISIAAPNPTMFKVRYEIVNANGQVIQCHGLIDDLIIEGNPPPAAGTPPAISLLLPQVDAVRDYALQDLVAFGNLSGTNLLPFIDFELTQVDTPDGTPSTQPIVPFPSLTPAQVNGTNVSFTFTLKPKGTMPMGRYTLLARVRDESGQEAVTTVNFSNFPDVLVFNGGPGLGAFQYGTIADGCQMAFYANGTEAYNPNSTEPPILVPKDIAAKWLTVDSPILGPSRTLGCPVGPATDSSVVVGVAQEFERGRIYESLAGNTVYSPKILTDSFSTISHSAGGSLSATVTADFKYIGWPVADPDSELDGDNPTWALQQFSQNNLGAAFYNTLEVRGRHPNETLYIERVGGDVDETSLAEADINQHPTVPARIEDATPTQWQTFPCSTPAGAVWPTSCDLSSYPTLTGANGVQQFATLDGRPECNQDPNCTCNGASDACSTPGLKAGAVPWWETTALGVTGNYEGIIRDFDEVGPHFGSHLANDDFPFNHDNCNPTVKRTLGFIGDITLVALGCSFGYLSLSSTPCDNTTSNLQGSDFCESDWNLHTRPLMDKRNYKFLSTGNLFKTPGSAAAGNVDNNDDFEIEFEQAYAKNDYFQNFQPLVGDMVAIHGRSIIDCGHCDPYKAEFHPPDVVVTMRSRVTRFGNAPSVRATGAWIWANGFLNASDGMSITGAGSATMSMYAPPRPTARSSLLRQENEAPYFQEQRVTVQKAFKSYGADYTFQANPTGVHLDDQLSGGQWHMTTGGAQYVDYVELSWSNDL